MSSGASLVAVALREARKELRKRAAQPMHSSDWRLEGEFELEERGKGWWRIRLNPADPLRLLAQEAQDADMPEVDTVERANCDHRVPEFRQIVCSVENLHVNPE